MEEYGTFENNYNVNKSNLSYSPFVPNISNKKQNTSKEFFLKLKSILGDSFLNKDVGDEDCFNYLNEWERFRVFVQSEKYKVVSLAVKESIFSSIFPLLDKKGVDSNQSIEKSVKIFISSLSSKDLLLINKNGLVEEKAMNLIKKGYFDLFLMLAEKNNNLNFNSLAISSNAIDYFNSLNVSIKSEKDKDLKKELNKLYTSKVLEFVEIISNRKRQVDESNNQLSYVIFNKIKNISNQILLKCVIDTIGTKDVDHLIENIDDNTLSNIIIESMFPEYSNTSAKKDIILTKLNETKDKKEIYLTKKINKTAKILNDEFRERSVNVKLELANDDKIVLAINFAQGYFENKILKENIVNLNNLPKPSSYKI